MRKPQSIHEHIRQRLHDRAGLSDPPKQIYSLADLERSEWSPQFEQLMRNRLIMGALRYGKLKASGKNYNRMAGAKKRMEQYLATGNREFLVDVANMALLEFVESSNRPECHWADVHGDHCHP